MALCEQDMKTKTEDQLSSVLRRSEDRPPASVILGKSLSLWTRRIVLCSKSSLCLKRGRSCIDLGVCVGRKNLPSTSLEHHHPQGHSNSPGGGVPGREPAATCGGLD
eukprot:6458387-Amphidinium_carterae.1